MGRVIVDKSREPLVVKMVAACGCKVTAAITSYSPKRLLEKKVSKF